MGGYKGLKKCSFCDYKSHLTSQVRRHESQAHGNRALPCTFSGCQMRISYHRLARHIREEHSENDSSMPELSLRQEQRNMHHEKFSDLSFVNPSATLGQFACPTCGKASRDRETLRKHVNRVHQKSYAEKARTKKHTCNWPGCGKAFTATSKLDDHMNSHTGDRPYECEHCNKTYTSKHEFSRHLKKYHKTNITLLNQAIREGIENETIELDLNTPLDDHGES